MRLTPCLVTSICGEQVRRYIPQILLPWEVLEESVPDGHLEREAIALHGEGLCSQIHRGFVV